MKKAIIFQSDETILAPYEVRGRLNNVYTEKVVQKLKTITDLYDTPINIDNLELHKKALSETEIMFSTWKMHYLSEDEIKTYMPNLKIVFYAAGSVQYFARPYLNLGIKVVSAWAASGIPVIEYTTSLIRLSLKGFLGVQKIAKSDWVKARGLACRYPGVYGDSTVGIIGAGMIGRGIIESLKSSDIKILVYDPYIAGEVINSFGICKLDSLNDIFKLSNVIINVSADLPSNKQMLRYEHFSAMQMYSTFINTGRNAQVHVPGLIKALNERMDLTAFLDVTDPDEPPKKDNPLLFLENLYITPHIAGSMGNELERQGIYMFMECERWLSGKKLNHEVTLKMLDTMA